MSVLYPDVFRTRIEADVNVVVINIEWISVAQGLCVTMTDLEQKP